MALGDRLEPPRTEKGGERVLSQARQATRGQGYINEVGENEATQHRTRNSPWQAGRPRPQPHETAPAQLPLPPAGAGPRVPAPTSGRVGTAPRVAAYPELGVDTGLCWLQLHLLPVLIQE